MTVSYTDAPAKTARTSGSFIRYEVEPLLTLAGQPEREDWATIAAEGFTVVINMRSDPERAATQKSSAEAVGMQYIHLPLPAYLLEPEDLATYHELMRAQQGRVFLHCRTATRVALIWLLEKVVYAGWSREQAEAVLRAAGYGEDSMDTFIFCADDYFERAEATV